MITTHRCIPLFPVLVFALCWYAPARLAAQESTTTVILVRHAERAAEPRDDPTLTAEGAARAHSLVEALGKAGVQAIYTSQYARTRQTAAPLAGELGVQAEAVPIAGDVRVATAELAQRIRARHAGQTVLVVGHSNTLPLLIEALGAGNVGEIQDHEYDNLFLVLLRSGGEAGVVRARYGSASSGG